MSRTCKPTHTLTAADVMTRAPVTVHHRTTLRAAARVLARWGGHLLPVTDDQERFVGVLTLADLLRWALDDRPGGGQDYDTSTWVDWQLMAPGTGRIDEARWHLAADPVVTAADAPLAELARRMRERRSCCAVVLDGRGRPVGLVSGADLLAAPPASPSREPGEHATPRSARRPLARPVG